MRRNFAGFVMHSDVDADGRMVGKKAQLPKSGKMAQPEGVLF